jgi:hypothetical protein
MASNPPSRSAKAVDLTDEQRRANAWAEQAIEQRIPQLRALAGRWTTTLGTLVGLLGGASVLNADDKVRALDSFWRITYGIIAFFAVGLAAVATYLGMLAAGEREFDVPPDLAGRVREMNNTFQRGRTFLRYSLVLAGIALVLLAISFAVRWYAPKA